ncbi:hypothetical protein DFH07DRAFT_706344, partial [Mycena maculata]
LHAQPFDTPLPWSIGNGIVWDSHIEFPKLLTSTDSTYDHANKPVEFRGDFVLVKQHELVASRPLASESEWLRMFSTWEAGVLLLYPHRCDELHGYQQMVTELFCAVPRKPQVAIDFDDKTRFKYSRSPFRQPGSFCHASSPPPNPMKQSVVPCENWNLRCCEIDPCEHGRLHGCCTECGDSHCARDQEDCYWCLLAQR